MILVTECHAELNARFVGLFASSHPAMFNWAQWNTETNNLIEGELEARCAKTADIITTAYWKMVSQYLCRRLSSHELSPDACKAWLQTGLALSPLSGTVAQHSIDVIIAWALIGEWSSRVLFPPPEGQWPRHGHPQCIGEFYLGKGLCSPCRMFQSTGIHTNVQRPVIPQAYGGAKVHMESALQTLRLQGWIPMASALIRTVKRPPICGATTDLRVTAGTSIDLAIRPTPLTQKEDLLLLSLWRRYCQVPKGCAFGTWLTGVNTGARAGQSTKVRHAHPVTSSST